MIFLRIYLYNQYALSLYLSAIMPKLFMLLIGCTPPERNIEQHDVFFGIGESTRDLVPQMISFWPGENRLHVDAWRTITRVSGYNIEVVPKEVGPNSTPIR